MWRNEEIVYPSINESIEINSFTTELAILENGEIPMPLQEFELGASEELYVIVNHELQRIGPDTFIKVKTDVNAKLTIINRTAGIYSPKFILNHPDFSTPVKGIDPAAKVRQHLDSIKNGGLMEKGKYPSGSKVFEGIPLKKVEAANKALVKLHQLANHLDKKPRVADFDSNNEVFGMKDLLSQPQFLEKQAAQDHFDQLNKGLEEFGWDDIKHFGGSILHSIEHGLEKVGGWALKMVNGVAHFVIELGGKILKFILKYASQVFSVINWLFKSFLGIDLEKLIKWLGYIFEWKDINRTHEALKGFVKEGISRLVGDISTGKKKIPKSFELIKNTINDGLESKFGKIPGNTLAGLNKKSNTSKRRVDPRANFAKHHLNSPAARKATKKYKDDFFSNLLSELEKSLEKFSNAEWKVIGVTFREIADRIDSLNVEDSLKEILEAISDTILTTMEDGILAIAEIAVKFLNAVKEILNKEWHIPVLSKLYEKMTGDQLTILDVSCLVLAIPITIIHKAITGKTPFTNEQVTHLHQRMNNQEPTAQEASELVVVLNLLLGGVGTCVTRAVSGELGLIAVNSANSLPPRFFIAKFIASLTGYIFTLLNKLVLGLSSKSWGNPFEDIMIFGQIIWPILNGLSIIDNKETRDAIATGSVLIGALSTILFGILYLDETTNSKKSDDNAAFSKFLENLALGISQTAIPLVKLSPVGTKSLNVVSVLGLGATVLINDVRASEAFSKGETFKPI